jgi:hypothetical protein
MSYVDEEVRGLIDSLNKMRKNLEGHTFSTDAHGALSRIHSDITLLSASITTTSVPSTLDLVDFNARAENIRLNVEQIIENQSD